MPTIEGEIRALWMHVDSRKGQKFCDRHKWMNSKLDTMQTV